MFFYVYIFLYKYNITIFHLNINWYTIIKYTYSSLFIQSFFYIINSNYHYNLGVSKRVFTRIILFKKNLYTIHIVIIDYLKRYQLYYVMLYDIKIKYDIFGRRIFDSID